MGKEITFNNTKIEKQKFHRYKDPMFFKDVDIDKILTSNKTSSVEKIINTLLVTWMMIII